MSVFSANEADSKYAVYRYPTHPAPGGSLQRTGVPQLRYNGHTASNTPATASVLTAAAAAGALSGAATSSSSGGAHAPDGLYREGITFCVNGSLKHRLSAAQAKICCDVLNAYSASMGTQQSALEAEAKKLRSALESDLKTHSDQQKAQYTSFGKVTPRFSEDSSEEIWKEMSALMSQMIKTEQAVRGLKGRLKGTSKENENEVSKKQKEADELKTKIKQLSSGCELLTHLSDLYPMPPPGASSAASSGAASNGSAKPEIHYTGVFKRTMEALVKSGTFSRSSRELRPVPEALNICKSALEARMKSCQERMAEIQSALPTQQEANTKAQEAAKSKVDELTAKRTALASAKTALEKLNATNQANDKLKKSMATQVAQHAYNYAMSQDPKEDAAMKAILELLKTNAQSNIDAQSKKSALAQLEEDISTLEIQDHRCKGIAKKAADKLKALTDENTALEREILTLGTGRSIISSLPTFQTKDNFERGSLHALCSFPNLAWENLKPLLDKQNINGTLDTFLNEKVHGYTPVCLLIKKGNLSTLINFLQAHQPNVFITEPGGMAPIQLLAAQKRWDKDANVETAIKLITELLKKQLGAASNPELFRKAMSSAIQIAESYECANIPNILKTFTI